MSLPSGTQLGPYEILSPIGAGGMGEVYRARDSRLGRMVAIKVLPPDSLSKPERVARFEQEAKAASARNHPNILTIYDIGQSGDTRYIAMEFVEGETVRQLIRRGPVPIKRALDIAAQAAGALAAAQEDRPNYFTLRQSRKDQSGEMLTVIVADKPLADAQIGENALKLSSEQVAQWEKEWGRQSERFELSGGAGRTWTKVEQEAGLDGTRRLTQDDPGPQTIYRIVGGDGPVLANVELKYGGAVTQKSAARNAPGRP